MDLLWISGGFLGGGFVVDFWWIFGQWICGGFLGGGFLVDFWAVDLWWISGGFLVIFCWCF